ncbi:metallophosphoesterase family protein [Leekyejoonella antrihumi]|uniref:Metallophosphoesterase n=1 Tax=Leekyejoonella antrihumi TaxID=1660198 RepID=A0A563DZ23_9MICO|nr:metallophosphoesterase [Leekyejoonella antrihumi]TWP35212.1 metallophosphoesterase [Leekyejoonella antrihumi]
MRWLLNRPHWQRTGVAARIVGVTILLALVGWVAGVAATTLFPTHVQTTYYQADVHLDLIPNSTVSVPTVLGDVDIHFDGPVPAPGIVVNSQLRRGVLEAFGTGTPAISALRPSSAQIDQVAHDMVIGVAVRFVAGLLLADVLTLLALRAWRAQPRQLLGVAAGATVLAVIAPTFAGWQAYRIDRVSNVATTSLLGYARANTDILGDLTHRSSEASRYVVSALALSNALQDKVAPDSPDAPTVLRVLFVSDIHGIDQYPLMKQIITDEDIDVVVDSGDLINFGDEQEASAAGIFKGIQSLGVPYLFIDGNHDSSSPTNHPLLPALGKIANVHLLQPGPGTYNEVSVAGVTSQASTIPATTVTATRTSRRSS